MKTPEGFSGMRGTPQELLTSWFETAYSSKDSARYDEMLASDFQFQFTLEDAESLGTSGPFWGKPSDLGSTWRMFGSSHVGGITLDIPAAPDSADTTCDGCRRITTRIDLRVVVNPNDTDPLNLVVTSKQTFIVAPDSSDSTQWVLRRHVEHEEFGKRRSSRDGEGPGGTEEHSWGSIKGLYRQLPDPERADGDGLAAPPRPTPRALR